MFILYNYGSGWFQRIGSPQEVIAPVVRGPLLGTVFSWRDPLRKEARGGLLFNFIFNFHKMAVVSDEAVGQIDPKRDVAKPP